MIRLLTPEFYSDHHHLVEVMDKNRKNGKLEDKERGYGVLLINIHNLQFALPLRSSMSHKDNFFTDIYKEYGRTYRKGLDYSKAVLISDAKYYSDRSFKIPDEEFYKIVHSQDKIIKQFTRYVNRYIKAFQSQDNNVLRNYSMSTLINYHSELGLAEVQTTL